MTRFRIDYHPHVDRDLMDISTLIADFAGFEAANRKLEEIEDVVRSLEDFPHIGTLRHDIRPNLRAIPAGGKGVICFTVDDERRTVLIIAITYAGADWSRRVAERN